MTRTFTKVQLRRGTKTQWAKANTILEIGEFGFESDTYRFKIGQLDKETGKLYAWNDLDYFGGTPHWNDINIDGNINLGEDACASGDWNPCEDDAWRLGVEDQRWQSAYISRTIDLSDLQLSVGPASEATGVDQPFLKVNGDDLATRTELEKLTTQNLKLRFPTPPDSNPTYYEQLFEILGRELPPEDGIATQDQFNFWAVQSLLHIDEVAHTDTGSNINIEGDIVIEHPDSNVIIGPEPGSDNAYPGNDACDKTLDIYNHTTVHCELHAKEGVWVKEGTEKHFVKANGTIDMKLPMEQSYWKDVPFVARTR